MKKRILIALLLIPTLLIGCDSLFDKGDVEKTFEGNQLGLFPLEDNNALADGSTSIEIQVITSNGRSSALAVTYSADPSSTAQEGVHYTFDSASPITVPAGDYTTDIGITFIPGSVAAGSEVLLVLNIDSAPGFKVSETLGSSNVFIAN